VVYAYVVYRQLCRVAVLLFFFILDRKEGGSTHRGEAAHTGVAVLLVPAGSTRHQLCQLLGGTIRSIAVQDLCVQQGVGAGVRPRKSAAPTHSPQ
jgi:hypothetical protein